MIRAIANSALVFLLLSASFTAANAGTTYGTDQSEWRVLDNAPVGASIELINEPLLAKSVIRTNGEGRLNAYLVGARSAVGGWNNQSEFLLSWRLQTNDTASVYVRVETELGWRVLVYNHASRNRLLNSTGRYIHHGLGTSFNNGEWHSWSRDLSADLAAAEPQNTLLAVYGLYVRGNLDIDAIELNQLNQAPQAIINGDSNVALGSAVLLNGLDSSDREGDIVSYLWRDESGNTLAESPDWQDTFNEVGTQRFSLEVGDSEGLSSVESISVRVMDVTIPSVYSDAESGSIDAWRLRDNTPSGATITNVVDQTSPENRAIEVVSSGIQNSFVLGYTNPERGWNNTLQTTISWRSRATEEFRVYVRVETTDGWRNIWYDSRSANSLSNSTGMYIHHGLGPSATDGQWHTFTRDLQADLATAEPNNTIVAVHAMILRGSVTIDDVALSSAIVVVEPPDSVSPEEAARLLAQASFGASDDAIAEVQRLGLEGWVDAQLLAKGPAHLDYVVSHREGPNRDPRHEIFWLNAVDGEDQLRHRVAFALSQLFVVSDIGFTLGNAQDGVTHFYDLLRNQAFGNYRQLLEDVALNPVMGIYLSMLQNDKGSEVDNTRADENFAREVLQLFSIGLKNLNPDGSPAGGNTFEQAHVEDFARVFTGWNYKDAGSWTRPLFTGQDLINPMEPDEDHHDTGAKTLLGGQVIPAGQSAREDLELALDNIFAHQNIAPFMSRHLITHLVTSNPSNQYVGRVAAVFNDNGEGVKGDMGATVKAVLMDDEARNPGNNPNFGKLREPVLRLSHLWRAFSVVPGNWSVRGEYNTYSPALKNLETQTGQAVLRSPSVFNFYQPGYSPPGPVRDANLVAPEFEIFTDGNILSTASRINNQIHRHYKQNPYLVELNPSQLDYEIELTLAANPQALLDRLNLLLMSGSMSEGLNTLLLNHIASLPNTDVGRRNRVQDAISLIVASPEYLVQR